MIIARLYSSIARAWDTLLVRSSISIILCTNDTTVVQPVITSTSVGGANGTPRFTINTDRFNQHYGDVGGYKVVVVRGSQVNPADIPDSQLAPAEESQFK